MSKKKSVGAAVLVVAGIAVLGLAGLAYAKYIASLSASGTAEIAKWDFEGENSSTTAVCRMTATIVSGTVASDNIAPGTSGECTMSLANTRSEVAVDYTITADENGSSNIPKNLELSSDGTTWGTLSGMSKTGTLAIGATSTTVTIYWRWPYETGTVTDGIAAGDENDTDDGEADGTMSIKFNISGVQHKPEKAL